MVAAPPSRERRLLQAAVLLASLVPITAGAAGVLAGPGFVGGGSGPAALDSHFRYLSGLLLGIGIAFLTSLPNIETQWLRFRTLGFIVIIGGMARLYGVVAGAMPGQAHLFALFMELAVTPALVLWQGRVARRA